jgi:transposase
MILAGWAGTKYIETAWWSRGRWRWPDSGDSDTQPTHWRPLPQPPKEGQ